MPLKFNPRTLMIPVRDIGLKIGEFFNAKLKWAISIIRGYGLKTFLFVTINEIRYKLTKHLYLTVGKNYKLEIVQGSRMYLHLHDTGISRELIMHKIREPASTKEIQRILRKGDIVMDIGANIGYYALMEARIVGEMGKIYAYEPVPNNVELLKKNIEVNHYENIEVFSTALGDRDGTSEIHLSEQSNWHSMSDLLTSDKVNKMPVEVLTVDKALENKDFPNFIRMDVEGYEIKIIRGMESTLKNSKLRRLFIELHPSLMKRHELVELLTTLKRHNFEIEMMAMTVGLSPERTYYSLTIDEVLQHGMPEPPHVGAQTFFTRGKKHEVAVTPKR